MDDPFITFRYALNVIQGNGWVFNPGEFLEGYSNFTWVIATVPALLLNIDPLSWARLLGLLSTIAMLAFLCFGVKKSDSKHSIRNSPTAAIVLTAQWPLAVWSMGGLETTFYALLVLVFVMSLDWLWREGARCAIIAAATSLTLLSMTRPEGVMWAALLVIPLIDRSKSEYRSKLLRVIIPFLGVFTIYNLWRLYTFGDLIPNTVHAKVGGGLMASILSGGRYLLSWAYGPSIVVVAIAGVAFADTVFGDFKKHGFTDDDRLKILCVGAVLWQVAFVLGTGGDWMPASRFVVPVLAPLALVAALMIDKWPIFVRAVVLGFLLIAGVIDAKFDPMTDWARWQPVASNEDLNVDGLKEIGHYLRVVSEPGDFFAATEAGAMPYYSELPFIDMLGLVDGHIAKLSGGLHQKGDAAYVLGREPRFVVLGMSGTPEDRVGTWKPDQEILALPQFAEYYEPIKEWPRFMPDSNYKQMLEGAMVLYVRKSDAPTSAPIKVKVGNDE